MIRLLVYSPLSTRGRNHNIQKTFSHFYCKFSSCWSWRGMLELQDHQDWLDFLELGFREKRQSFLFVGLFPFYPALFLNYMNVCTTHEQQEWSCITNLCNCSGFLKRNFFFQIQGEQGPVGPPGVRGAPGVGIVGPKASATNMTNLLLSSLWGSRKCNIEIRVSIIYFCRI